MLNSHRRRPRRHISYGEAQAKAARHGRSLTHEHRGALGRVYLLGPASPGGRTIIGYTLDDLSPHLPR